MLLKAILLAGLTVAIYWPAMRADFVYDDAHFVINNDIVRHGGFHLNTARPLTLESYRVNLWLTGEKPVYFHLTNLAIHLLNGALVFLLLRSLFAIEPLAALFGAGIFLLHPMASEAVIYISGRSELLAMLFMLLSVLAFARSWYVVAIATFVLAVASKEIALLTPVLWWIVAQRQRRHVWPVLAALAIGLALSPLRAYVTVIRENANIASFYGIASLWGRLIVPLGLNIDHDFTSQSAALGIVAGAVILSVMGVAFFGRQSASGIALLWMGALTLPHVLVEPRGYLTEHHIYGPLCGFALLAATCMQRFRFGALTPESLQARGE